MSQPLATTLRPLTLGAVLEGFRSVAAGRVARLLLVALVSGLLGACDDATHAQGVIIREHAPRIQAIVHDDLARAATGVRAAAGRMVRGFTVTDPAQREREMRRALTLLTEPPRGIPELMISPMSFIAVTDENGIVICRDAEPDRMAGTNAARFPHVARALREGVETHEVVEWRDSEDGPASVLMVHAVPMQLDGRVVGAMIVGTPLWRTAQRLTRQLQAEAASEQGTILWVYLYRGDTLHHHGTPPDLDTIVPDGAARAAGLARSPGGFTGQVVQFGRWYAYGVEPLPELGDDIGFIVWRSDPV